MKISILTISAGRPELFKKMMDSLYRTTKGHDLEVVCVIDDAPETSRLATEFNVDVLDYSIEKRGALWAWNKALWHSDGDILVPSGDDQLFYDGWLDYALESHEKRLNGYGVVGMNDLAYDGNKQVATMFLFDRKYCKEQMGGVFAPPHYEYLCIDLEWNEKAKILNKFYWDERSIVEHVHSAHGKRPMDKLDEFKAGISDKDMETYLERKKNGFPIDYEAII